jgi:hypothetical protein
VLAGWIIPSHHITKSRNSKNAAIVLICSLVRRANTLRHALARWVSCVIRGNGWFYELAKSEREKLPARANWGQAVDPELSPSTRVTVSRAEWLDTGRCLATQPRIRTWIPVTVKATGIINQYIGVDKRITLIWTIFTYFTRGLFNGTIKDSGDIESKRKMLPIMVAAWTKAWNKILMLKYWERAF